MGIVGGIPQTSFAPKGVLFACVRAHSLSNSKFIRI
jgi:hypothetical protein